MGRILAMIVKELLEVLRDPLSRFTLIAPPIMQLVLFSAAATLEVKNVTIGVYDRDGGVASAEFVNQLAGSPNIKRIVPIESPDSLRTAIDRQRVIGVLVFDEGFSRDVAAHHPATIQAIFDGRRSNAAQIVEGYVERIAATTGGVVRSTTQGGGQTIVTNWFNPNLDYLWFIMPALLVTISALSALPITVQSVAREREIGTFDQLMVSPLRLHEILIGKMVPPVLMGLFTATLCLIVIPLFYGVPFKGSVILFYVAVVFAMMSMNGIGMVVSSIAQTQQQAFLGMFVVVVPMTVLSGFTSPIENMPGWLQMIAQANPLKHFLVLTEGLFLKRMPASDVFSNVWPLAVIAAVTLTVATLQFRSRAE